MDMRATGIFTLMGLLLAFGQAGAADLGPAHNSAFERALVVARDRSLSQESKLERLAEIKENHVAATYGLKESRHQELVDWFMFLDVFSSYSLVLKSSLANGAIEEMAATYRLIQNDRAGSLQISQLMYNAYLAVWDFDSAKMIARDAPLILQQSLPDGNYVGRSSTPSFYELVGGEMRLSKVNLSYGIAIIITAGCGVTDGAIEDVARDQGLLRALKAGNAIWLIPSSKEVDFSAYFEQVAAHPLQRIVISSDNANWPEVDFTTTPSIVIFKDGAVFQRLAGWPAAGEPYSELIAALNDLGIH